MAAAYDWLLFEYLQWFMWQVEQSGANNSGFRANFLIGGKISVDHEKLRRRIKIEADCLKPAGSHCYHYHEEDSQSTDWQGLLNLHSGNCIENSNNSPLSCQ